MMPLSLQIMSSAKASPDNTRYFRSCPFRVILFPANTFRPVKVFGSLAFAGANMVTPFNETISGVSEMLDELMV